MFEKLFRDPHLAMATIVFDYQLISVGLAVGRGLDFEMLLVAILAQAKVSCRERFIDSTAARDEILNLP